MTWWQRLRQRWQLERELDTELRYHLERLIGDLVAGGHSPGEARRRATEEFGSVEELKDACRDVRGTRPAHDLAFDLRTAARMLSRDPASSLLAIFALALGIGISTMLFTIVDALCLRTFPLDRVERLVEIGVMTPSGARQGLSPEGFRRLESAESDTLSGLAAYVVRPAVVRDADSAAERITVAYVSGALFETLHIRPERGRGVAVADDRTGAEPVVAVGDRFRAALRTTGEAGVVGRSLRVDGTSTTVVGTMPAGFAYPDRADAWRPLSALDLPDDDPALTVVGRLADAATLEQARVAIARILGEARIGSEREARAVIVPLDERYRNPVTNPAWLAFITAAVLLVIIAASNVATLLLSRGARRQREIAVRLALGGTPARIVRQLLVETSLLAAAGGLGAAAVGAIGLRIFARAIPEGGIPYWVSLHMNGTVFAALSATCLGTVLLAGLAPALATVRGGTRATLREEGRILGPGATARRWTWVFLTSQLALTVILLAGVGLTTNDLLARDRYEGLSPDRLLTFSVDLPPESYPDATAQEAYVGRLRESLVASGRISSVTLADALPTAPRGARRVVMGAEPAPSDPPVRATSIGPDFFGTVSLELLAGREPSPVASGAPEVVVNARFADLFLGDAPLGRTVRLAPLSGPGAVETRVVVGVAPDLQVRRSQGDPAIFVPLSAASWAGATLIAATSGDAAALAPVVRERAREIDPDVPLLRLQSLADATWSARWNARVSQGLISTIAFAALLLATLGLTALTMQWVALSGHELGVRLALGARPLQIVWLVLRRVLLQLAVGLAVGGVGAWAWPTGGLSAPANLAAVAGVVLAVTLGAALWPAHRAARVDPLTVIRGA